MTGSCMDPCDDSRQSRRDPAGSLADLLRANGVLVREAADWPDLAAEELALALAPHALALCEAVRMAGDRIAEAVLQAGIGDATATYAAMGSWTGPGVQEEKLRAFAEEDGDGG